MATIPVGTKFLGVDSSVPTPELNGRTINNKTEYFTVEDIAAAAVGPAGPQGIQGPEGPQGDLGPVGPAGLEWQGLWDTDTAYAADDAVGYDGASWFCILAVTGTGNDTPDVDTTHWALLAAQGAQGQPGATGAQGPEGPQGPAGTIGAKTVGNVIFGYAPYNTLTYDINKIPTNGNSDGGLAYLPDTTGLQIGKELIVSCFSDGTFNIKTFDSSYKIINNNINPDSELSAIQVKISKGDILKFTLIDNGYWILDFVVTSKENRTLYSLTGGSSGSPRIINGTRVNAMSTGYYALPSSSSSIASNINEVIVYAQNATVTIQAATGGNISSTTNNSYSSGYGILKYSTVKFLRYQGEDWIAEPIIGTFPSFNGITLNASQGYSINETLSNATTSALSEADLNTAYPTMGNVNYPIGIKVYCKNISGGGLVYIKDTYSTWVSMPITAVV